MLVESSLALSCTDGDEESTTCGPPVGMTVEDVSEYDCWVCKCRASFTSFMSTLFDIELTCLSHASVLNSILHEQLSYFRIHVRNNKIV